MKKEKSALDKLRNIIKEGFREYDGDIMEEAIDLIDELQKNDEILTSLFNRQQSEVDRMAEQLKGAQTITHGTGEISYFIHPESATVWQELMDAIKSASATTALPVIINAINSTGSRF